PAPTVETVAGGMDRDSVNRLATLQRLQDEITAATQAVADADMLLLDGSLVPQPQDRPDNDSPLFEQYETVIDQYRALYEAAAENG
ncbi:MAG: hypothetical protein ABEI97_00770, partial [Candidatus Nanohaloarchaea archaeon]